MSKAAELANLIGNINMGGGGVNRNVIINGAMNVAQRGTSSTGLGASSGYYVCDRWYLYANATAGRLTMSQDSSVPTGKGFANSLKLDCTTADTSIASAEGLQITQKIEGQNLQGFAKGTSEAKPFALSFYVKGNGNATYVAELNDTDNSNRHVGKTFNVTSDWTKVEITFPADTTGTFDDDNAGSLNLNIFLHSGSFNTSGTLQQTWGTLSQGDRAAGISSFFSSTDNTFFITGVQLEVGQNPTEFEHEPFEKTFAMCQRYFEKEIPTWGTSRSGDNVIHSSGYFKVKKRASPTMTLVNDTYSSSPAIQQTNLHYYVTYDANNASSSLNATYDADSEL